MRKVIFCYESALAPIMKYHRQSTTEALFLTVLEAGSPKSECVHSHGLVRAHFLACRRPPSCHVLIWQREGGKRLRLSRVSLLVRTLILMDQGPTLMTSFNHNSIKPLFPNTVTLGGRALTYGFGRDTIQSMASCFLISSCRAKLFFSTHPQPQVVS